MSLSLCCPFPPFLALAPSLSRFHSLVPSFTLSHPLVLPCLLSHALTLSLARSRSLAPPLVFSRPFSLTLSLSRSLSHALSYPADEPLQIDLIHSHAICLHAVWQPSDELFIHHDPIYLYQYVYKCICTYNAYVYTYICI